MATARIATTPSSLSVMLVRALDARGIDGRALAARAGIAAEQLTDPDGRVPRAALTELWRLAVEATADEAFGLHAVRHAQPTSFHALGYAILASATARDALERIVRFRRFIGEVSRPAIEDEGDETAFVVGIAGPPGLPYESIDAYLAITIRQLRQLSEDPRFAPVRVELRRPQPREATPYEQLFRCPIRFGAPRNALVLCRAALDRPLTSAHPELARVNDQVVVAYLARVDSAGIVDRVRRALVEELPSGVPSQTEIARRLGMSPRSLQRRLADEGVVFRDVLGEVRATLARQHVLAGKLTITEIGFVLGFGDTSAFSRAFKRWTGLSPRRFAQSARRH